MVQSLTVGFSCSLSGQYDSRGQQVLNALRLWKDYVRKRSSPQNLRVDFVFEDDQSKRTSARSCYEHLVDRTDIDVFLGPYSSGLTHEALQVARDQHRILWNHGGASDSLVREEYEGMINILSPSSHYFQAIPSLLKEENIRPGAIGILFSQRGTFADNIRQGLVNQAEQIGISTVTEAYEPPIEKSYQRLDTLVDRDPAIILIMSSYEEELKAIRYLKQRQTGEYLLGCVASGVKTFHKQLGPLSDHVIGPAQWSRAVQTDPVLGPSSDWFIREYRGRFDGEPEYLATQAFACGLIFMKVLIEIDDPGFDRVLEKAHDLQTNTLYGHFKLDEETGEQIGHRINYVQWQNGRQEVIWPPDLRTSQLHYPDT